MNGLMLRRRAMMGQDTPPGTLKYWLCGDDAPVNGVWRDRIGNLNCSLQGSSAYDASNHLYNFDGEGNYGSCGGANTINFSMGHHFVLKFDMMIKFDGTNTTWLDVASVAESNRAIGFTMRKTDTRDNAYMSLNWKMNGNNSGAELPLNVRLLQNPGIPIEHLDQFVHVKGYYAIINAGNGHDQFVANCNGITVYGDPQLPKADYSPTWRTDNPNYSGIFLGRGLSAPSYNANIKLRDLKIYKID